MGAAGPVVAGKMLFVPSGYAGVRNGMTGNALLAVWFTLITAVPLQSGLGGL